MSVYAVLQSIVVLVVSLFLVALLSDRVIRYVLVLSRIFGLSEMAAGFILLSVATSLPELSVSTVAAIIGKGGLSTGNILGSNIANLTIILGLAVLLSKTEIKLNGHPQKELVQFLFLSSVIPLFIFQRGTIGPVLGIVLLTLFIYFSVVLSRKAEKSGSVEPTEPKEQYKKGDLVAIGIKFLVSVGLVVVSSKFVVDSSVEIAESIQLPASIIGATAVGLGTSLPELATTIQALKKKLFGMALGNVIGSCITNLTLVLGMSALISISEANVDILAVQSIMFYVLLSSLSVWYLVGVNERISRRAAFLLSVLYIFFILQQIGISVFIF